MTQPDSDPGRRDAGRHDRRPAGRRRGVGARPAPPGRPEATATPRAATRPFSSTPPPPPSPPPSASRRAARRALHPEPALIEHYSARLRAAYDSASCSRRPRRPRRGRAASPAAGDPRPRRPARPPPGRGRPADLEALQQRRTLQPRDRDGLADHRLHELPHPGLRRPDAAARRRARRAGRARSARATRPTSGFTQEQLGWAPWLPPFEPEDATDEQRAVLPDSGSTRRTSGCWRSTRPCSASGPRPTTASSTPHGGPAARRARALRRRHLARQRLRLLRVGAQPPRRPDQQAHRRRPARCSTRASAPQLDVRWRARSDLAAALTVTPPAATQSHIGRLRELGLEDLEILDVMQAAAFFGWANRLMLTLGEPVRGGSSAARTRQRE